MSLLDTGSFQRGQPALTEYVKLLSLLNVLCWSQALQNQTHCSKSEVLQTVNILFFCYSFNVCSICLGKKNQHVMAAEKHRHVTKTWFEQFVSWYFAPSLPQRIRSELKTNTTLSLCYSAHKSSNHTFSKIYKISPDTNFYKTKHIQLENPSTVDPSINLSITFFF